MGKKQKGKSPLRLLFSLLILGVIIVMFFWLTKGVCRWFSHPWDGKDQLNMAIEAESGDVVIISLNPEKDMVVVVLVPSNLQVETPWFGTYQASKLSLLAKQEKDAYIFNRSLSYFLGLPIDQGLTGTSFKISGGEFNIKEQVANFFFPFCSLKHWRIWRFLNDRNVFWKTIYLAEFCREEQLPDKNYILLLDTDRLVEVADYFADPDVRLEGIPVSVFNLGDKEGLAQKASSLIGTMGGTVVQIGNSQKDFSGNCLISFPTEDIAQTKTVTRLINVLGCQPEQDVNAVGIQIFIRNVKI